LGEAVNRGTVEIEVEDAQGQKYARRLNMESITSEDLDSDFLSKIGLMPYRIKVAPVLDEVVAGGAAARGGLRSGDRIIGVDGQSVDRWESFVEAIVVHPDQAVNIDVTRGAEQFSLSVRPDRVTENGRTFGRIGVKPRVNTAEVEKLRVLVRYGPVESMGLAVKKVWDMSAFSLKMMGRMLMGDVSWKNLSGPIAIADYAGQSAMLGWIPYVNFLALISISLGVLNLLPVPVLDGGQLMYYMAEILKGSPVSDRIMQIGQQVGLTLLLGLTAFAFYNDIHRLLTG
jgi:regulator of sigma E protease